MDLTGLMEEEEVRTLAKIMRILALINRKGGVGKTTATYNLAAGLSQLGNRILMLDTDTQKASLSTWAGRGADDLLDGSLELADILMDPKLTPQAIYPSTIKNVDVIPCTARTIAALDKVESKPLPDYMIERIVAQIPPGYDYLLIDCPPALSRVVVATIIAADEVIVPMRPQPMSIDAVSELLQIVDEIVESGARRKPGAPRVRALITEPDNTKMGKDAIDNVREALEHVFQTTVRRNVKLAQAYGFRRSIFEHAPRSIGAADYRNIALELVGASA